MVRHHVAGRGRPPFADLASPIHRRAKSPRELLQFSASRPRPSIGADIRQRCERLTRDRSARRSGASEVTPNRSDRSRLSRLGMGTWGTSLRQLQRTGRGKRRGSHRELTNVGVRTLKTDARLITEADASRPGRPAPIHPLVSFRLSGRLESREPSAMVFPWHRISPAVAAMRIPPPPHGVL